MMHLCKNEAICGGCLDFKTPVGLSFLAMKGLTKRLSHVGRLSLVCEHQFDVPISGSVGKPFYFYHVRKGGQEKGFVVGELQKMRLRPATMYESTSLAHAGFQRIRAAVECIDRGWFTLRDSVPFVCLATTMVADDLRFHPVLNCRSGREMWVEGTIGEECLPLDGLVPVTNHGFQHWNP